MLLREAPAGSKPVNVAWLMTEVWVKTKSSAVSVWIFPLLAGRDSVPILPSGSPVEKENGAAVTCDPLPSKAPQVAAKPRSTALIAFVLVKLRTAVALVI